MVMPHKRVQTRVKSVAKKKQQSGVVLIVSLVFLIALTAVAAALMQNTTTDMKMSGASEEKVIATQEAISASDEVIFRQVNGGVGNNAFALPLVRFPVVVTGTLSKTNLEKNTVASIDIANNILELEADCPHSRSASSTQVFTCNVLRVQVNREYGRKNTNNVVVNTGIAQQLLRN
ncbi:PilX N-terminal [Colwellia chukchiensis]|uniref:PilX N-terminal n=1 Tax=Colwellia chukchiensis TaxID=641665 RepID=A0A1H7FW35_9GAMM|nr:pilus assembly PilX N-terminal domain-containing protein [Colwellia chukchiensis]SEK30138.1 PilX N-terminal [Colwellia chukchiensis]